MQAGARRARPSARLDQGRSQAVGDRLMTRNIFLIGIVMILREITAQWKLRSKPLQSAESLKPIR
jgi:hypothetical protein